MQETLTVKSDPTSFGEVESVVYRPGSWLLIGVGLTFVCGGIWIYGTAGKQFPPPWPIAAFAACFAGLGALAMLAGLNASLVRRIKHAPRSILPGVPSEPVIREGLVVHGRLTHELAPTEDGGWELRPSEKLWRNDKRFFVAFGVPFAIGFIGALSWVFHREGLAWHLAVIPAAFITIAIFGTVVGLIAMAARASYRRLSMLAYRKASDDLVLDFQQEWSAKNDEIHEGIKWFFQPGDDRRQLAIPRKLVAAVQLCPWKFVIGARREQSITWAVQGVLVLAPDETGTYHRLPLLLTSDFVRAARLMQRLADELQVPYLFCADADGWAEEEARAKLRAPLKAGGMQT